MNENDVLFKSKNNLSIVKSRLEKRNNQKINYTCPVHGTNISLCYGDIFNHTLYKGPINDSNVCFMLKVMNQVIYTRRQPKNYPVFKLFIEENILKIMMYIDSRHLACIIKTFKLFDPDPETRAIAGIAYMFSIYDKFFQSFCPTLTRNTRIDTPIKKNYEDYLLGNDNVITIDFFDKGGYKEMIGRNKTIYKLWLAVFSLECYREGSLWHLMLENGDINSNGVNYGEALSIRRLMEEFKSFVKC
jgi:hypothetical protein